MVSVDRGEFAYAPPSARAGNVITLSADEAHHLLRVRRVKTGQPVWVTDGEGLVHKCRLENDGRLLINTTHPEWGEPPRQITLLMAVLKADGNRDVVDIATQMGAGSVVFFQAEHSEGRLATDKIPRLERAAVVAIKQCGRARLPRISVCAHLADAIAAVPAAASRFVAHPMTGGAIANADSSIGAEVALLVGPEGGLSETEIASARAAGFVSLTLAARRLRSETAVAAGLAVLLIGMGESGLHE